MLLLDGISSWLKFKLILYSQTCDWPELCRQGKRQSPIALCKENSKRASIPPLKFRYYKNRFRACIENTGHSVAIRLSDDDEIEVPTVSGGNLDGEYILDNIHFHWEGEHTINGKRYPLEGHLVHFNRKFETMENALKQPKGLIVLAVMFKIANCQNRNLDNIIEATENIACEIKTPARIRGGVIVNNFLPKNRSKFYTYEGSLTTPDCNENVGWIVFEEPILINKDQLSMLTSINSEEGEPLKENARDLQEQNDREVLYATKGSSDSSIKKFIKEKLGSKG